MTVVVVGWIILSLYPFSFLFLFFDVHIVFYQHDS